ncbi:organ-specific protein P4-like [Humulus lupulus]|uniref:organ-specific protein P4-like n=1 Tax=Humulus lupulus TaxID=3486 RepID=UPI002B40D71A|nr:organ-specific protein P4-like [Humulus lupulus]
MKKSFSTFIFVCSIIVLADISDARQDVGEYWKNIMKDQPMPDAIRDLFHDQELPSLSGSIKRDRFVKDFDLRPNVIIYHSSHSQPHGVMNHKRHQKPINKKISRDN